MLRMIGAIGNWRKRFTVGLRALTFSIVVLLAMTPFAPLPTVKSAPIIGVSVDSQVLVAGAENVIVFTVSNYGDSSAQNVNATIAVPTNNMLLIDSDGRWNITNLDAGQSTNITVKAYVSPSAAGSLIQVTIRVTYYSGITQSDSRTIGFSVAAADLAGAYLIPYFSTYDFQAAQNNTVSLIIENQGGRDATNISVALGTPTGLGSSLEGLSPLTLLTGTQSLSTGATQFLLYNNTGRWNFESLGANGSLTLPLTIFAMPSAAGSIYLFPVALTYTDGFTYTQVTRYATVKVASVPSTGLNFHVAIDPQEFSSGGITHARINVTNIGYQDMEAVSVQLSVAGSSISSGAGSLTGTGIPLTPTSASPFVLLGQDGTWSLGDISPGESITLPIDIYCSPSASGSVQSLSVTISYTDALSKAKQETKTIGVIVRGLVEIIVVDSSTFPQTITVGKAFSASINIINIGTSSAKGVIIFPQSNGNLTSASAERIFLGDVDVNIPTSLTISYIASNITSGNYQITIPYTYKDSLGEWFNSSLSVPLRLTVSSTNETQPTESGAGGILGILAGYWWIIAVVVLVAIAAIFLLRRRGKRRT